MTRKKPDKLLDIAFIILLILNLVSYPIILATPLAKADDTGTSSSSSSSSGSGSSSADNSSSNNSSSGSSSSTGNTSSSSDNTASTDSSSSSGSTASDNSTGTTSTTQDNSSTTDTTQTTSSDGTTTGSTNQSQTPPASSSSTDSSNNQSNQSGVSANTTDTSSGQTDPQSSPTDNSTSVNATDNTTNSAASSSSTGGNTIEGDTSAQTTIDGSTSPVDSGTSPEIVSGTAPDTGTGQTAPSNDASSGGSSDGGSNKSNSDGSSSDQGTGGSAPANTITTGDATAQAQAVNTVNTNVTTENSAEVVQNITGTYVGDVNLLNTFQSVLDKAKALNQQDQEAFQEININNINTAQNVTNTISADSTSGSNSINNTTGSASISTGSAQAAAGAINFINTNITGNNWLLAVVNVAGKWQGNLIVPGDGLFSAPATNWVFDKVTNVNIAENIRNFILSGANSGMNSSQSAGGSSNISTGNATASASATNLVNTNITQNNWFFLLINNSGHWIGQVIGWDKNTGTASTYSYNFGSFIGAGAAPAGENISVYNYNQASNISNTTLAGADSGNNSISTSGNSTITTGEADARASAINFINTNITGNNWLFGVVNNAGDWTGNVIFGYPDLAVSISTDKSKVNPGDNLTYTIDYKNVGLARCDNVNLMLALASDLSVQSENAGYSKMNGNNLYWSLPGLDPGGEGKIEVSAAVGSNVPAGGTTLESAAGVTTTTKEEVLSNNYASADTPVNSTVSITDDSSQSKKDSSLSITRQDDAQVKMGEVATHTIYLKNDGAYDLYNITVKEKIKNPSGDPATEYDWNIAKLKKGQKATISYQIVLDPPAPTGVYKFTASAIGYDNYNNKIKSGMAEAEVRLVGNAGVLPAAGISGGQNSPVISSSGATNGNYPGAVMGESDYKEPIRIPLEALAVALFILLLALARKRIRNLKWERALRWGQAVKNMLFTIFF